MAHCPHPTGSAQHELRVEPTLTDPLTCSECGLTVRRCAECDGFNRIAARFCTICGTSLPPLKSRTTGLMSAGAIRSAPEKAPKFQLDKCLVLPKHHWPEMWLGGSVEGLFVFSRDMKSATAPMALHWIPGYRFVARAGHALSQAIPPTAQWVQRPLVTLQGLFIATETVLHFFPAHGYSAPFEAVTWSPSNRNKRIAGIAPGSDGHPVLLIRDTNKPLDLELWLGNAQAGEWGQKSKQRKAIPDGACNSNCVLGVSPAWPDFCWVYDGTVLAAFNLNPKSSEPPQRFPIKDGMIPALLAEKRMTAGYFDPLVIRGRGNDRLFVVYPYRGDGTAGTEALPAILPLSLADQPVRPSIARTGGVGWIEPDRWGHGFFAGTESGLRRFESGHQPLWDTDHLNHRGGLAAFGDDWLAAVVPPQDHLGSGGRGYVVAYPCQKNQDQYKIEERARATLPSGEYVIPGMPPLAHGEDLFVALRKGNEVTAPITVYQLQILRTGG